EDGIRVFHVTGVQTCALPICSFSGGEGSSRASPLESPPPTPVPVRRRASPPTPLRTGAGDGESARPVRRHRGSRTPLRSHHNARDRKSVVYGSSLDETGIAIV